MRKLRRAMTIKEVIEELQLEDQDRLVVCQRDGEGNGFSPLADWWTGAYKADSNWSGEAGLEALDDEDRRAGYTDEDVVVGGVPAIFFRPIN